MAEVDDRLQKKAEILEKQCGEVALRAMQAYWREHHADIGALVQDNPDYEAFIPWAATVSQGITNIIQMALGGQAEAKLLALLGLQQVDLLLSVVEKIAYYRGYVRGQQAAQLGTWQVAEEESDS